MNIAFGLMAAAFVALIGLMQLITGRFTGDQSKYKEYTPESLAKAARLTGFFFLLTGVFLALQNLVSQSIITGVPRYLFIVLTAASAVTAVICSQKLLKKGDNHDSN